MLIKKPSDIKLSEITDKKLDLNRRQFMAAAGVVAAEIALPGFFSPLSPAYAGEKLAGAQKSRLSTTEPVNSFKDITTYNNFYEFGTDKYSPATNAARSQAPARIHNGGVRE